jgi:prephenate dehydratase
MKQVPCTDLGVAIQGIEGSFHQIAAQTFFGPDVPVVCCNNFRDLFKVLADKKKTFAGVMAIENSIAGSLLPNYNLLQLSDLEVVGEVYLEIKHQLLANPGVVIEDIKEVHSHPMAILQCLEFLDKYNWKIVETEDTALSARLLHQHHSKHIAAIASKLSAKLFGLNTLTGNIHTLKNNYTRFLVLQRRGERSFSTEGNKASVNFNAPDERGSLAKILARIAEAGVNLTKLQSFPIPGSDWLYSFHADMEFEDIDLFNKLIINVMPITDQLKVYGVYQSGKRKK